MSIYLFTDISVYLSIWGIIQLIWNILGETCSELLVQGKLHQITVNIWKLAAAKPVIYCRRLAALNHNLKDNLPY